MGKWILALALMATTARAAGADELVEAPQAPERIRFKDRALDNLDHLSDQFRLHVSRLSFDLLDLRFDPRKRKAKLKLDASAGSRVGLKLDSDVTFRGRFARIDATLDLALGGRILTVDLPEFDVGPTSVLGEQGVELRLPILYGEF